MQGSALYNLTMSQPVPPENPIRWGPANINRGYVVNSRTNTDKRSIFVGNLPDHTTRQELEEIFGEFGHIVQVNIIRKEFGKFFWAVYKARKITLASADDLSRSRCHQCLQLHRICVSRRGDCSSQFRGTIPISYPKKSPKTYPFSQREFMLRTSRLRVEPKEYSARRQRFGNGAPPTPFLRSLSSVPPRQGAGQGMWRDTRNAGGPGGRQFSGWGREYYGGNHNHHAPHNQMSSSMGGMSSYQANMHSPAFMTPPSSSLHSSSTTGTMYSASPYIQSSGNTPYANPLFNAGQYTMGPILETEEHY